MTFSFILTNLIKYGMETIDLKQVHNFIRFVSQFSILNMNQYSSTFEHEEDD